MDVVRLGSKERKNSKDFRKTYFAPTILRTRYAILVEYADLDEDILFKVFMEFVTIFFFLSFGFLAMRHEGFLAP